MLRRWSGWRDDRVPGFIAFNERRSSTWRTYVFTNPGTIDADELRNRVRAGGGTAVPPSIELLPARMEAPQNRQWSIGVGTQLALSLTLNADYVDQDVRKVFAQVNLNWLDLSKTPPQRVLSDAYGNIVAWGDFARARYRALLTTLSAVRIRAVGSRSRIRSRPRKRIGMSKPTRCRPTEPASST